jgi:hypothetical protein
MSTTEMMEQPPVTQPVAEHAWLTKLVGEWIVESEIDMGPEAGIQKSTGREKASMFGGLWVLAEGEGEMPGGGTMHYKTGIGFDVTFKEYRGFWIADVSSHLWKYVGEMSEDGRVLTLNCEGPHMQKDGETALYRDVIEIVDENRRVMTSYGQDDSGNWNRFMTATYTRVGS